MSIVTLNDRGVRSVSAFGSLNTGSMVFIKKLTASSSSDLTFHDGTSSVVFDSTYKEYLFTFNNIHPATDGANFTFQGNAVGGSGFNETITSSYFRAVHNEADSASGLAYDGDFDQAQGTAFQMLSPNIGTDNDQSVSGQLTIFNPSSTTFVKHFISNSNIYQASDYCTTPYVAGYFNTTSAIDEIQFKMSSGNIDAGDICLYGIL